MKRTLTLCVLALAVGAATARAGSYGTEAPFVLGTSARASALGVSGVSLADDAAIQYYNPAALSHLEWKEFAFYRSNLFEAGAYYHTLSYAQPLLSNGTLAVSFMRLDVGGIEERDVTNQLLSTDLHNAQTRLLLGYGRTVASGISAGFNVVFDNHTFGDYSGSAVGLDLGLSASQTMGGARWIRGIREGIVIRNIVEPSLKLDRERVTDPAQLALGMSVLSEVENVTMVTSFDLINPKYSPVALHIGQELTYAGNYSLRFGVDETTPTFGFGARYRNVALDYAYRSEDIGSNHRISLGVRFGTSLSERRAANWQRREQEINTRLGRRMAEMEDEQIARTLNQGKELLAEGSYGEALNYFAATLLWDPENEEANVLSIQCRYEDAMRNARGAADKGDFPGALVYLREAQRVQPDDPTAAALIAHCNDRIAATQNDVATVNRLLKTAIDLYAERRFPEALGGFDEALAIAPQHALALEYRDKCKANIRTEVERHRRAARQFAARDDYEQAIQSLRSALEYGRDAAIELEIVRYTRLFKDQSKVDPPPPPVDPIVKPKPDNAHLEGRYLSGMQYFDKGDYPRAIEQLSEVWTVDPMFHNVTTMLSRAYLFVGMNYYAEQNYVQAIKMWEKALTVDPDNTKAERYLRKASEEARKLGGLKDEG
jgi:tetratricopeptide (TPR) repeat protein